ncbi:hypothetical protein U9M48_017608, partial [Paspalum notatum var. saurae]
HGVVVKLLTFATRYNPVPVHPRKEKSRASFPVHSPFPVHFLHEELPPVALDPGDGGCSQTTEPRFCPFLLHARNGSSSRSRRRSDPGRGRGAAAIGHGVGTSAGNGLGAAGSDLALGATYASHLQAGAPSAPLRAPHDVLVQPVRAPAPLRAPLRVQTQGPWAPFRVPAATPLRAPLRPATPFRAPLGSHPQATAFHGASPWTTPPPGAGSHPHGMAEASTGPGAALEAGLGYPAGRGQGETGTGLALGSLTGVQLDGAEAAVGHDPADVDASGIVDVGVRYYKEGDEGYIPSPAMVGNQYDVDMNMDGRGRGRGRGRAASVAARGRVRGHGRGQPAATSSSEVLPVGQNTTVVGASSSQRPPKNNADSQTPEHLTLVCKLFAEQVEKRNRPNTHLNGVGYAEVSDRFYQMTGIELSRTQLKNKWDKLKPDLVNWQKLKRRQTGTGWDHLRKTIEMDPWWWKKMKAEISGCAKFKKGSLQNEDLLIKMFKNITNDESDHWNPMTENPTTPESHVPVELDDDSTLVEQDNLFDGANILPDGNAAEDVSPSVPSAKKNLEFKRNCHEAAGEVTIKQVMNLGEACGATFGTNEHFIATKLFVKREQKEMFMTLDTDEKRLIWLRMMHDDQYGA